MTIQTADRIIGGIRIAAAANRELARALMASGDQRYYLVGHDLRALCRHLAKLADQVDPRREYPCKSPAPARPAQEKSS